jgi:Fe-S-cluster containining protein
MQITKLSAESILPLTCSRSGTCCFGKAVLLNPWELMRLGREKKITAKVFRDLYCEFGGIQLRFDGAADKKGQKACSQYDESSGCSVHLGRPLACRLYPLGRQIQFEKATYMFEGEIFPCLNDCAEVLELPKLSVGDYLKGQAAAPFEKSQDHYLTVMQNIADIAFELLLDSGLAASGDTKTIGLWRILGIESPEILAIRIGQEWMDCLMIPKINNASENPEVFIQKHNDLLLIKAKEQFENIQTLQELHEAAVLMFAIALHLSRGLGADTRGISEHWIATAIQHGAKELE